MRLLLDSHVFVWTKAEPAHLSQEARAAIIDPDNDVFVSIASPWELWIKHAKKPIPGFGSVLDSASGFAAAMRESRIALLDITLDHVAAAIALAAIHRDSFDRMIIAQAIIEKLTIVTADPVFEKYKVCRVLPA